MGVDLGDLLPKTRITLEELSKKTVAVDAYNALYQFLAVIRGLRGEPLMDRQGRVTSHLSGLLYRNAHLMELGIRPVYVFDGTAPAEKEAEVKRRRRVKEEAVVKYEEALKRGDLKAAKTYAQATARIKDDMVGDAKRLLSLMGIPWTQAPSEGEAQASYMAARGDVWAVASQDHDALLFGAPRLVRNLTLSGKRKLPGRDLYVEIYPELISLEEALDKLNLTREQLIDLGILVGTDFNPDGVKGVGPKSALRLIHEYGSVEGALTELKEAYFPTSPERIRRIFLQPNVTDSYRLYWRPPDVEGVIRFLCDERDFSEARVRKAMEAVTKAAAESEKKRTLTDWFAG
ncbi:MAG: flap endonuclease-1 [Candidatus Bathyarchaeia archaeon]